MSHQKLLECIASNWQTEAFHSIWLYIVYSVEYKLSCCRTDTFWIDASSGSGLVDRVLKSTVGPHLTNMYSIKRIVMDVVTLSSTYLLLCLDGALRSTGRSSSPSNRQDILLSHHAADTDTYVHVQCIHGEDNDFSYKSDTRLVEILLW